MRKITVMTCVALLAMPVYATDTDNSEDVDTAVVHVVHDRDESSSDASYYFFVSVGFNINSHMHTTLKIPRFQINESMDIHYKYDAPALSAGLDFGGISFGPHITWRNDNGIRMRAITGRLELMPMPFPMDVAPYIIGEMGMAEIKYDDLDFHDRSYLYGMGWGIRINLTENAFIKIYNMHTYTRFSDEVADIPMRLRVHDNQIGMSVGAKF